MLECEKTLQHNNITLPQLHPQSHLMSYYGIDYTSNGSQESVTDINSPKLCHINLNNK